MSADVLFPEHDSKAQIYGLGVVSYRSISDCFLVIVPFLCLKPTTLGAKISKSCTLRLRRLLTELISSYDTGRVASVC